MSLQIPVDKNSAPVDAHGTFQPLMAKEGRITHVVMGLKGLNNFAGKM